MYGYKEEFYGLTQDLIFFIVMFISQLSESVFSWKKLGIFTFYLLQLYENVCLEKVVIVYNVYCIYLSENILCKYIQLYSSVRTIK